MLQWLNDNIIWGAPMLIIYLLVGFVFSVKVKFGQLTHLKYIFSQTLFCKTKEKGDKKNLSPLQTLTSALATTLGTGNIVAVGAAVSIGGAGAVFWMLVSAFLGMATCYGENVLGMRYRMQRRDGSWFGGAFHYITAAFNTPVMGKLYALFCLTASVGIGNMTQINAMSGALNNAFNIPTWLIGIIAAVLLAWLIFGGVRLLGKVTERVIPVISAIYVLGCIAVIFINITALPQVTARIITEAFDFRAVTGGIFGSAMLKSMSWGFRRGIFSNEAGLGSSVMLNCATCSQNAEKQGMWAMLQVFFDTIVMCTLTALTILVTGADKIATDGITNAVYAFSGVFGDYSAGFVAISLTVFAITTAAGWSVYGSNSLEYLTGGKGKTVFLLVFAAATVVGATMKIELVWQLSDLLNGLMAMPNLPAMLILSGEVKNFVTEPNFNGKAVEITSRRI
ncbi:MAG: amino acid carrier protein [Firmicutes bacterium]|nr:amino acid carrier protein [[Eubacterium] siraeum]MCM1487632.1 amino acid carrier protein [Bacillota bacterium]